jgi:hypothetical protein
MQYTAKYGANLKFEDEEKPRATNEILGLKTATIIKFMDDIFF